MGWVRCGGNGSSSGELVIGDIIPRMTSNTTPKGTCSASYVYSGRYAYYGFTTWMNGNINSGSDFWYNGGGANQYLQYEFESSVTIYSILFGTITNEDGLGGRFTVQYSSDGTTFTDSDTFNITTKDYTQYNLGAPIYCKYLRIYIVSNFRVISGLRALGYVGQYDTATKILKGTSIPVSGQGADGQVYLQYVDTTLPMGYTAKEYLATGSTVGAYINTGLVSTRKTYCEIKYQYTAQPTNNTWFFGAFQSYGIILGYQNSNTQGYLKTGGNLVAYDTNIHIVEIKGSGIYLDGELKQSGSWSEVPLNIPIYLFSRGGDNPAINNTRIYYAKIWEGDTLVRYLVPAINSSSVTGMYDFVNGVFYTNAGTQSFTADGTGSTFADEITTTYAKVSGSWQSLIGTDIDDISNTEIANNVIVSQLAERVSSADVRITESSHDSSYPAWGAFNGTSPTNLRTPQSNTCWCASNGEQTSYIQYDMVNSFNLCSLIVRCFSNYSGDWSGNIQVLGSTDGANWDNILASNNTFALTALFQAFTTVIIPLNPSQKWRYVRIQGEHFCVYYSPSLYIDEIGIYGYLDSVKRVCSLDFTQTVTDNRYVTNTSGLGLVPTTSDAIPQAITFDMSKSWSYKLRFKCNSFLNRAMVMLGVCKSVSLYEVSPLIQVNANGAGLWVGASTSGSGWTYQLNLSTTLTAGTWYYVELAWDTTTLSITLYDDTLNQIETDSVSASQIVSQFPMCIGSVGQVATYTSNVITYDLYNCSIKNDGSELW